MKHINLFEAFASKNISAIEKFLKLLNKEDSNVLVDTLKSISQETDIPLSNFKGEYVKLMSAIKMNSDQDSIVKFWFSLKNGLTGITMSKKSDAKLLNRDWMKPTFIQNFISSNLLVTRTLRDLLWTEERYKSIIDSEFALVINTTELSKGLRDIKARRKENKKDALSFSSDAYIRLKNQEERKDKLEIRRGISKHEVRDKIYDIIKKYRCHNPNDFIDCCFEIYYRGKINKIMLDAILAEFENHHMPRTTRYGKYGYGVYGKYGYGEYDS